MFKTYSTLFNRSHASAISWYKEKSVTFDQGSEERDRLSWDQNEKIQIFWCDFLQVGFKPYEIDRTGPDNFFGLKYEN